MNSRHKILFVVVDNYKTERLGVQILSSIALEEGYERDIVIIDSMTTAEALEKIRAFQPRIIAYSGMTYENIPLQDFNRQVRQSGLKYLSIFGGHHYTFNPEEIVKDKAIDILCRGEGEEAFRKFIRAVRDGEDYWHIRNLLVRRGDEIIENPVGPLLQDLDSIPFGDRELFSSDLKSDNLFGETKLFMIGRGCPHRCSYCFNEKYNVLYRNSGSKKILRFHGVDYIIAEIKKVLEKYDLEFIAFIDDSFGYLPVEVIEEFALKYKKEINRPFAAQFHANTLTEETIIKLKDAGLFHVNIGVECSNEDINAKLLQRGRIRNEDIIRASEILRKHKITFWALVMMGFPVDNPLEIDWETIKFCRKIKPTWAQFNILLPIQNTTIWNYSIENGYLDPKGFLDSNKLPSNFTETRFIYKDPSFANKISNLHKFASIIVKFPFLTPVVKVLMLFPPNVLYQYTFFLWYGYWKTMGTYRAKFSFGLVLNGLRAARKYLRRY